MKAVRVASPVLMLSVLVTGAGDDRPYGLGRPATAEEIAGWDIDIIPDGEGLPPGRGNVADGARIYRLKCGVCHGSLEPTARASFWDEPPATGYPQLVGGQGTLATPHPLRTVGSYWPWATTLWDYVHRTMPPAAPQSLAPSEVYALVAYILWANGIVGADAEMNRDTLPSVSMPNRDGFLPIDPRPDVGTGSD